MKLEVGKTYIDSNGKLHIIDRIDDKPNSSYAKVYPYISTESLSFTENGIFNIYQPGGMSDLVKEVFITPNNPEETSTLTKREHFAAIVLQGILANNYSVGVLKNDLIRDAIKYTDEALKELKNEPKKGTFVNKTTSYDGSISTSYEEERKIQAGTITGFHINAPSGPISVPISDFSSPLKMEKAIITGRYKPQYAYFLRRY